MPLWGFRKDCPLPVVFVCRRGSIRRGGVNGFVRDLRHGALFLLVSFLLLGCSPTVDDAGWAGVVRDSAGVTIVSNPETPLWSDGEAWRVEEEITIGSGTDSPETQFGQITGLDVDSDGTIYVLDTQAQAVRVFDAQGQFMRSVGRPGAGPGEISRWSSAVFVRTSGEVLVPDIGNLRVNLYDELGESTGTLTIDPNRGEPLKWGMASDGRIVVQFKLGRGEGRGGERIFALGPDGAVADTLLVFPEGTGIEGTGSTASGSVAFAPEALWHFPKSGGIYSGANGEYRIREHALDGHVTRIVSKAYPRQVVSEGEKSRIHREALAELEARGTPAPFVQQMMTGFGVADYYPAFTSIQSGPWGSLLVQRTLPVSELSDISGLRLASNPAAIASNEWDVFDADGRYLGVLALPERFTPLACVGENIYGVWLDEWDVQHVKRLRIVQPAP